MSQREITKHLNSMGPRMAQVALMRASLGDWDATKALLPYVIPKAHRASLPMSCAIDLDISTGTKAKETLQRIAVAIGKQEIGLEEGTLMMDVVGRALERITVVDMGELVERVEELETAPQNNSLQQSTRQPISRANGSTPKWGNIVKIDDLPPTEDM